MVRTSFEAMNILLTNEIIQMCGLLINKTFRITAVGIS